MKVKINGLLDGLIYQFKHNDNEFFENLKYFVKFYKGVESTKIKADDVGVCNIMWVFGYENQEIIKLLRKIRTTTKEDEYFFKTKQERLNALLEIKLYLNENKTNL